MHFFLNLINLIQNKIYNKSNISASFTTYSSDNHYQNESLSIHRWTGADRAQKGPRTHTPQQTHTKTDTY